MVVQSAEGEAIEAGSLGTRKGRANVIAGLQL